MKYSLRPIEEMLIPILKGMAQRRKIKLEPKPKYLSPIQKKK